MNILNTKINFSAIRSLVDAAENLQSAGEDQKAGEVLLSLAVRIDEEVGGLSAKTVNSIKSRVLGVEV